MDPGSAGGGINQRAGDRILRLFPTICRLKRKSWQGEEEFLERRQDKRMNVVDQNGSGVFLNRRTKSRHLNPSENDSIGLLDLKTPQYRPAGFLLLVFSHCIYWPKCAQDEQRPSQILIARTALFLGRGFQSHPSNCSKVASSI